MKKGFYAKIAWQGIQKNKNLYTPYLFTCIGMVMMYYIIAFLGENKLVSTIRGGATVQMILGLGAVVLRVFSLIFLFYTNSFLMKRRKKEFGLYHVLGMGKGNLTRILVWETLMIGGISLGAGLVFGILFSKLAELGLLNLIGSDIAYSLRIETSSIWETFLCFAVIFVLLLLNSIRQIWFSSSIDLLRSENTGEKPPKANWLLALAGALILGTAYWLALSIQDPLSAMMWFIVAVILVIVATYLLFVAGSVVLCRLLQKNKKYYYKTNHFVSVSSMIYRMKRNGGGLASICILSTMVLVMLSAVTCLYGGKENVLSDRYPRDLIVQITELVFDEGQVFDEEREEIRKDFENIVKENNRETENILDYQWVYFRAYRNGETIGTNPGMENGNFTGCQVMLVDLAEYNAMMNASENLEPDEALAYVNQNDSVGTTLAMDGGKTYHVKKILDQFMGNGMAAYSATVTVILVVPDLKEAVESIPEGVNAGWTWYYGFDLSGKKDADSEESIEKGMLNKLAELTGQTSRETALRYQIESREVNRADFYGLYGGIFFLGILLGIVFLFATVLIMYYKQISEGYEDQSRFEIMQKVGMTKKDIQKSIHSQILTVFFMPLLGAGLHLCFAFPMVEKILLIFGIDNRVLLIQICLGCFGIFGLFYVLVYQITSGAYYRIVSGKREKQ